MAQIPRKTVRKLVTLPLEVAEEVDRFREATGASSDSDALKVLISWGLTRSDTPRDLFERCKRATTSGATLGDVITSVVADHPLVENAIVGSHSLDVYLKTSDLDSENQIRFRFVRGEKEWICERTENHGRDWNTVVFVAPKSSTAEIGGRPPARGKAGELDDDIPF